MSRDFPDWIDALKAAAGRRSFTGTMPLSWMGRLEGLLAPGAEGEIEFSVEFDFDEQRQIRARTRVRGSLPLVCQRTLVAYSHALDSGSEVAIVAAASKVESLPENYEPMVCEELRVPLARLVEEEILLALPLVPHAPGTEPVLEASGEMGRDSDQPAGPFAELEKLRRG